MGRGKRRRQFEKARPAPRGSASAQERLAWAREKWREDPSISVRGSGGMREQLFQLFGAAATDEQLHEVRAEVAEERTLVQRAAAERRAFSNKPRLVLAPRPADEGTGEEAGAAPEEDQPPPQPPAREERLPINHAESCRARRERFTEMVRESPGRSVGELLLALREETGTGMDSATAYALARRVRAELTEEQVEPQPAEPREAADGSSYNRAEIAKDLTDLLLGAVPNLRRFLVEIDEEGRALVEMEVSKIERTAIALPSQKKEDAP